MRRWLVQGLYGFVGYYSGQPILSLFTWKLCQSEGDIILFRFVLSDLRRFAGSTEISLVAYTIYDKFFLNQTRRAANAHTSLARRHACIHRVDV